MWLIEIYSPRFGFLHRDFAKVNIFIISSLFTVFVDSFKRSLFEIMDLFVLYGFIIINMGGATAGTSGKDCFVLQEKQCMRICGNRLEIIRLVPADTAVFVRLGTNAKYGIFTPSDLMLVASSLPV